MKPLMIDFGTFAIPVDRVILVKPFDPGIMVEHAGPDGEGYTSYSKMSYKEFIEKYGQLEEKDEN